jgi:hypothetical protein
MSVRLLAAAIVIIAATVSSTVLAQQPGPPPGAGDKNLGSDVLPGVKGRSNEMERVKRDAEKPEKKKDDAEGTFPQIKEDFEQIQHINSSVLQANTSGAAFDYARISDASAEIKKRAARLKTNLFGADNEKQTKEKEEKGQLDMKTLLTALDDAISKFVHSPIFQNTGVVNPDDSAKAKHLLEDVIKLSTRVGKEAERLKKENGS